MDEEAKKRVEEEFERIGQACPMGRPGEGDFPEWNGDPIPRLPEFFNNTAHIWDAKFGDGYKSLHAAIAAQIPETEDPISILDVGCGTGLEFEHIFERAPNALLTGLDQAPRMLEQIERKYADRMNQITLIESSCLEWPDGLSGFDHALSILTVHHFPPDVKTGIYTDILASLKDTGTYVEGDQSAATTEQEANTLNQFYAWIAKLPDGTRGGWNYDITLTVATNTRLMEEAGFADCRHVWDKRKNERSSGHAVIVAQAS